MQLEGTYVHARSGIEFPAAVAGFQRVAPMQYDASATDIGIGYRRTWSESSRIFMAEVTVFVFPPPGTEDGKAMTPAEQFEQEIVHLRERRVGVREVRRTTSDATFRGEPVTVRAADFEFRADASQGGLPMRTLVAGFAAGTWRVTCRATLMPPRHDVPLRAVDALLEGLQLPATGLASSDATAK